MDLLKKEKRVGLHGASKKNEKGGGELNMGERGGKVGKEKKTFSKQAIESKVYYGKGGIRMEKCLQTKNWGRR